MTATPGPQQGCGERVAVRIDGQAAVATCTDHDDMGHYDPALNLSWPAGDGRLLTEADR